MLKIAAKAVLIPIIEVLMYPKFLSIKLVAISVLFSILTGCAGLSGVDPLEYSDTASENNSFVFGTFSQVRHSHQITGLWVELENIDVGTTLLFPFKTKNQFMAIPLEPANYRIKQFYHAKGGFGPGTWVESDFNVFPIPPKYAYLSIPFKVKRNEAVYLGDFFGSTGRGVAKPGVWFSFVGSIEKIEQRYIEAKEKLTEFYKHINVHETDAAYPQHGN